MHWLAGLLRTRAFVWHGGLSCVRPFPCERYRCALMDSMHTQHELDVSFQSSRVGGCKHDGVLFALQSLNQHIGGFATAAYIVFGSVC